MHNINSVEYDPLDKTIDVKNMKIVKNPYKFDFDEKVAIWLDTLYDDSNLSKDDFYVKVQKALKEFCEK